MNMAKEDRADPDGSNRIAAILLFCGIAAGIFFGGYSSYRRYERQYRDEVGRTLSAIADLKVRELAHFRSERLADGDIFFHNKAFAALARRYFADPLDADARTQLLDWMSNAKASGKYDSLRLLDARGATRLSVPGSLPPLSPIVARHAAETLRSKRVDFLDLYRDPRDGRVYLSVEVPIHSEGRGHQLLGILTMRIDAGTYLYPSIQAWPIPSQTAETLIIRRDGNDALFLNDPRFRKDGALKLRIPLSRTDVPAVRAVLGRTGIAEGVDYRGMRVIADTRPIPDSPWAMVARMDVSEVVAPLRQRLWATILITVVLLLAAGAGLGFVWTRQSAGFYRERYAAAESLRASEERMRAITDSAFDAILMMDGDGRVAYWNPAAEAMFGYTEEQVLGRDMHELLTPQRYRAAQCAGVAEFLRTGKGPILNTARELRALRKNGDEFDVSLSVSGVRLGGRQYAVGIVRDITQRVKAEQELRKLSAAVNENPASIFITDAKGDIEFANLGFAHATGYTFEEARGRNPRILKSGHQPPELYREFWKTISSGGVWRGEFLNRKKNGDLYWESVSVSPLKDAEGVITHYVAIQSDITARKRFDLELRKLSLAVAASPASIVITDADGRIEYVNQRFAEVTGYSAEEALGRNPRILKSGHQPPELYREFWKTISSGEVWRGEFLNRKKNGDLYWELVSVSPLKNAEGVITHYVAVKEEITERKRLDAELRQAVEAAEAANRAKSAFLANMSHEIRTPMNAILGFAQLLRRDPAATPRQKQQIDTINRSGEHLLTLINDILEMAKAEAGRTTLSPSAFDLHALLDDVGGMLRPRAEAKGLRLDMGSCAGLPRFVVTDEGKLRQILLNLLGNAVKFTEKGTVALRVGIRDAAQGLKMTAAVEDTGPGIAPRELALLFRPFEQAQAGRAAGAGTGLGLAISREYARLMGGDITAQSRPGQGSVFSFELDLKEASPEAAPKNTQPRRVQGLKPGQPRYRVLAADDKKDNREFLGQLLGPMGFDVRPAADGEEALRLFEAWRPQLVLTDLQMPVMDGYEAMRRIRASAGGTETKIIAVTASIFGETSRRALEAGADDLIIKPFREAELFDKIRSLLGAEYVYEAEAPAEAAGARDAGTPDPGSWAGLPRELLAQLREAAVNGDFDRLSELAGRVEAGDARAAGELRALAGKFDAQSVLDRLPKEEAA